MSFISRKKCSVGVLALLLGAACGGGGSGDIGCAREPVTLDDGTRIHDLECGSGMVAERGMTARVSYGATLEGSEEVFDRSGPEGLTFRLGAGQVVAGWDEGLVGMKVGGVRTLVVPSELAYGEAGLAPHVPPDATVGYEVELLELNDPEE